MLASLLTAALTVASPQSPADVPPLLFENGMPRQFSWAVDTLTLRHGAGWVRSRAVLNDFVFAASFRLADSSSRVEIGIRALVADKFWPKRGCAILLDATDDPGLIHGRGVEPHASDAHAQSPPTAGEWHSLIIKGEGARVTISVDQQTPSVTEIPFYSGPILVHTLSGTAEFRGISIRTLSPQIEALPDTDDEEPDPRVKIPVLVKEVRPVYSSDAMQKKVQGEVKLKAIVLQDGTVGPVWTTTYLDPDLEQNAVAAASQWRFKPATFEGRPVAMQVQIILSFTLK